MSYGRTAITQQPKKRVMGHATKIEVRDTLDEYKVVFTGSTQETATFLNLKCKESVSHATYSGSLIRKQYSVKRV